MWPEAKAAFKAGIFGIILAGLCSMTLGLLSGLVPVGPIVCFASMAGVMIPMVMVVAGALAVWASQSPGLFIERPRGKPYKAVAASLVAGLTTTAGAALMFALALAVSPGKVFPEWIRLEGLNTYGYLGVAVLLAAYVALAAIGGILYGIVVPEEPARY